APSTISSREYRADSEPLRIFYFAFPSGRNFDHSASMTMMLISVKPKILAGIMSFCAVLNGAAAEKKDILFVATPLTEEGAVTGGIEGAGLRRGRQYLRGQFCEAGNDW